VLSIISMVAGILGLVVSWTGWGGIFAIAAVVLGFIGRSKEPQAKGFWLTGIILGFVAIGIALLVIIFAIIAIIAYSSALSTLK
jgi:hypothetical protein